MSVEESVDTVTYKADGLNLVLPASASSPDQIVAKGGLPMISDLAFSLVILLYVSVAFCFVFFLFCWNTYDNNANDDDIDDGKNRRCILNSLDSNEFIRKNALAVAIIPPTPPIVAHRVHVEPTEESACLLMEESNDPKEFHIDVKDGFDKF